MQFGEIPVNSAEGAILAHSVTCHTTTLKKGRILTKSDIAQLQQAAITHIYAARLAHDDVGEDEAAATLAVAVAGNGIIHQAAFTGRANLYASTAGLVQIDEQALRALNRLHENITLATLPNFSRVAARQLVGTVKIIPYAISGALMAQALHTIVSPVLQLYPFKSKKIGLIITRVSNTKPGLVAKSETAMRERVQALGSQITHCRVASHAVATVAEAIGSLQAAGCELLLLFGASATADRGDVVPQALVQAGGEIVHLGMPVDPGNLTMLGRLGECPVVGVPSCARSPKWNGFDLILQRVLADIHVSAHDMMDMGQGGLLAEIATRPAPREGQPEILCAPHISGLLLAAGQSSRMGQNKLLADLKGLPLISHSLQLMQQLDLHEVVVVTGHQADVLQAQLNQHPHLRTVHNPNYADGLATSLQAGLSAISPDAEAVLIALGDMPSVSPSTVNRLMAAFSVADHRTICVPTYQGQRGNPVLWGAQHFAALQSLSGDKGGKQLMAELANEIVEVPCNDAAILLDVDTPEALAQVRSASAP